MPQMHVPDCHKHQPAECSMFTLQAAFMKRARANGQASMGKFGGEGTANGGDSLYEANYKY